MDPEQYSKRMRRIRIGILGGVAVLVLALMPIVCKVIHLSHVDRALRTLQAGAAYARDYRKKNGAWPKHLDGLWDRYYRPSNAWGNEFVYLVRKDGFVFASHGADGQADTGDHWSLRARGVHVNRGECRTAGKDDLVISDKGWHWFCDSPHLEQRRG
jgi:hypothetical protein